MMEELEMRVKKHLDRLLERYPVLLPIRQSIIDAYAIMENCYLKGGKLLLAGNGGSAADSEHMAAELMKSFRLPRPISQEMAKKLEAIDSERGESLAAHLEICLTAIPLVAHEAMTTAYGNDVDSTSVFAQQLFGFGKKGDVLIEFSTSGNSENVILAAVTAKAMGISVIGVLGKDGGELASFSNVAVKVPETETHFVQELHLPIYHCWCSMLEEKFFGTDA